MALMTRRRCPRSIPACSFVLTEKCRETLGGVLFGAGPFCQRDVPNLYSATGTSAFSAPHVQVLIPRKNRDRIRQILSVAVTKRGSSCTSLVTTTCGESADRSYDFWALWGLVSKVAWRVSLPGENAEW